LTGHLGYAMGSFMPYALGGVAFAHNIISENQDILSGGVQVGGAASSSKTQIGYTIGAGATAMLADHISAFGEVRYSDYGTSYYNGDGIIGAGAASMTDTSVRGGLNYHF
jgi:outer membrane immunogenic protein